MKKPPVKAPAERVVKDNWRQTRRHFSAEDKIRIVLDGLRGDDSIAELCRREGAAQCVLWPQLGRKAAITRTPQKNFLNRDIPLDVPVTASIGFASKPSP